MKEEEARKHIHTHIHSANILKWKIKFIPKFCDVIRSEICEEKKRIKTKM